MKKVFVDQKGRRWKRTKWILLIIIVIAVDIGIFYVPNIINSNKVNAVTCCKEGGEIDYAKDLAYSGKLSNSPIIGEGYLQRVVQIKDGWLIDPYTKKIYRKIKSEERETLGNKEYAVERYQNINSRYVSITFDDGPDPAYTPRVLDILAKEKVRATFFITGENATKYPEIVKRIVNEGHIVANHTFTHVDFDYHSSIRGRGELNYTDHIINALTGKETNYFRLPYGGNDEKSINDNVRGILQAQQLGYEVVSFNFDTDDWKFTENNQSSIDNLGNEGNIILLHDGGGNREATIGYLDKLINKAKVENFPFVTVNDLSKKPNEVYRNDKSKKIQLLLPSIRRKERKASSK